MLEMSEIEHGTFLCQLGPLSRLKGIFRAFCKVCDKGAGADKTARKRGAGVIDADEVRPVFDAPEARGDEICNPLTGKS